MTTANTSLILSNSSDALFRLWGKWISDQFAAFGWVNVSQVFATGTSWADVTTPAAANAARVTEIWRMADTHQGAAPLYLEISYGETGTTDCPGLRIRLGTGATGSTLNGNFYDSGGTYFGSNTLNTNTLTCYASGDTDRIVFAMGVSGTSWATANVLGFSIERRKNPSGVSQATGWLFVRWGGSSTRGTIAFKQDGSNPTTGTIVASINVIGAFTNEANLTFDNKQAILPVIYCLGPMEIGLNLVASPAAAYGPGATFTVDIMGATHTYITTGEWAGFTPGAGNASNLEPSIRYE